MEIKKSVIEKLVFAKFDLLDLDKFSSFVLVDQISIFLSLSLIFMIPFLFSWLCLFLALLSKKPATNSLKVVYNIKISDATTILLKFLINLL